MLKLTSRFQINCQSIDDTIDYRFDKALFL